MKTILPTILALTLLLTSPAPGQGRSSLLDKAPAAATAGKEFLGTWEGFMADSDGSRHGDIKLEITADTITASNPRGGQIMGAGTYRLSSSTSKHRRIDARGTSGQFAGKSYAGILSIEGDTLKWCSANDNPRSTRPTLLKTNVQAGHFLMVLERRK